MNRPPKSLPLFYMKSISVISFDRLGGGRGGPEAHCWTTASEKMSRERLTSSGTPDAGAVPEQGVLPVQAHAAQEKNPCMVPKDTNE